MSVQPLPRVALIFALACGGTQGEGAEPDIASDSASDSASADEGRDESVDATEAHPDEGRDDSAEPIDEGTSSPFADVTAASGTASSLRVTVQSPDTGCDGYADWWEVLRSDGSLAYRRILAHSHVDEQPFTRSGGPLGVGETDRIYVRAHFSTTGYGGQALVGTLSEGFTPAERVPTAAGVESAEPQPDGCAF
ncbi:MAG: hypothetical protein AAF938_27480 [Myxococcota bacterium]